MKNNHITVAYGDEPEKLIRDIFSSELDIEKIIGSKNKMVVIKPNLVSPEPSESGMTTDPKLVGAVIALLREKGYENIKIMESSFVFNDDTGIAFEACGYNALSEAYHVPLVDLKRDEVVSIEAADMQINVCRQVLEADFIINMPVLKAHCSTKLTCALKNLKGCIPDSEKKRFHALDLNRPVAVLAKIVNPGLTIVDGIIGGLTFEVGGRPEKINRVIVGTDMVLIDSYIADLMGYQVEQVKYLPIAEEIGVGSTDLSRAEIVELNMEDRPKSIHLECKNLEVFQKHIHERQACSACYGNLTHALVNLSEKGKLDYLHVPILVGQGYRKQYCEGIGIGVCTSKCGISLKKCPPSTEEIEAFIEEKLSPN